MEQDKRPITIKDVAAALGIHKSTVSVALSGKGAISTYTRKRIIMTAREMGYEPNPIAQRLATGVKNNVVAILCGKLNTGISTEKLFAIQSMLNDAALESAIYTSSHSKSASAQLQGTTAHHICLQRPRALIVNTPFDTPHVFEELQSYINKGGLIVSYDSAVPLECDQIIFDREDNAYQTTRYLLERGHRKIGLSLSFLNISPAIASQFLRDQRFLGYKRALDERGITVREDWLFENRTYELGGQDLAQRFLALDERPTAMCIVNDYVALAFMCEVIEAGLRIPEDVSVIGHDNQPVAAYCPAPLTSATQPYLQISKMVVDTLLTRLNGDASSPMNIVIKGDIVERKSVIPV
jgi:DNA-binding LacI/PurR family transcriptional regulator